MKITDALSGEHGVLLEFLREVTRALQNTRDPAAARPVLLAFSRVLLTHARLENDLLFAPLEKVMGREGVLQRMYEEHLEIEHGLTEALEGPAAQMADRFRSATHVILPHFEKEERIVFPMAAASLGDAALERQGAAWDEQRRSMVLAAPRGKPA